ncbi:MAG: hypothetical protein AABZ57_01965 [Candidatus Margulisiibacteriota bacterium]
MISKRKGQYKKRVFLFLVAAPPNSPQHAEVIGLIEQRKSITGFTSEAKAERLLLDEDIFSKLKALEPKT